MNARAMVRIRGFLLLLVAGCGPSGPSGSSGSSGALVVTTPGNGSYPVDAAYILAATFSDSSDQAPWSFDVNWGDGSDTSGTTSTIGAIPAAHAFTTEGRSYRVTFSIRNRSGASRGGSFLLTTTTPVIVAAGDIADCSRTGDDATARSLDTIPGIVMPLGDNAYPNGTVAEYSQCYAPNWGRQKPRTRPVAGNHDYYTAGAAGYFDYFGPSAGDPAKGYYSFTAGSWLVIVLNTGSEKPVNYEAGSPQELWLRSQLDTHSQQCVLAVWHHPRFSTTVERPAIRPEVTALWNALYQHGVDLVLNGHDHSYQRFAPQKPDGTADPAFGIRQIVVGTGGGEGLYPFVTVPAGSNLEVRNNDTIGVLKVTLKAGGYEWKFIRSAGGTFIDSGSGTCHGRPA